MGHVEAALKSESGLKYGIVLEDESGPSFPIIFVIVVKEALISLIQSHSAIRHNKEPVSRAVSEFTIFTMTIMHLVYPRKFCITIVFDFSWDDCYFQEKLEIIVMQNFGELTRCIIVYVKIANYPSL